MSAIFKMKGGLKQEKRSKEVASLLMDQKRQIQQMNAQFSTAMKGSSRLASKSGRTFSKSPFRGNSRPRATQVKSSKNISGKVLARNASI